MKFICVQPGINYYTWQVEVMINNFIRNGINPNDIHIVCSYYGEASEKWLKLKEHYSNVNFFFYIDRRKKSKYVSSIRPHLLYQHWLANPYLENEIIFYHDCDIVFTKQVDFSGLLGDQTCYVSDTISYIGANYIRSKGEHLLDIMTDIIGVDKQFIINNEKNSGGAQYLLKNIPSEFWNKVYWDSENIYKPIVKLQNGNHSDPFQIWCADMWAVLWNLWFWDKKVEVSKKLDFAWSTSHIIEWDRCSIYHNAGATGNEKHLFYKGQYQNTTPYNNISVEHFNNKFCSYRYVEEILKTKEVTCLK